MTVINYESMEKSKVLQSAKESTSAQIWESIFEIFPEFKMVIEAQKNELNECIYACKTHFGSISKRCMYDFMIKNGTNRGNKYKYKRWQLK